MKFYLLPVLVLLTAVFSPFSATRTADRIFYLSPVEDTGLARGFPRNLLATKTWDGGGATNNWSGGAARRQRFGYGLQSRFYGL